MSFHCLESVVGEASGYFERDSSSSNKPQLLPALAEILREPPALSAVSRLNARGNKRRSRRTPEPPAAQRCHLVMRTNMTRFRLTPKITAAFASSCGANVVRWSSRLLIGKHFQIKQLQNQKLSFATCVILVFNLVFCGRQFLSFRCQTTQNLLFF